jgi:hypothetical protein
MMLRYISLVLSGVRFKPSAQSWQIGQKEDKAANATRIPE